MPKELRFTEQDEAGNVLATYVESTRDKDSASRIDIIYPENTKSIWQKLLDIFLPAGYPHSVTDDYLEYQIYDSLQAFSSSIASLLSSRAVLSSVGVGDSTASPTAALLLSILQESAGRIATILFAHRFGTSLEPECKMYRLLADILNDIAFVLDCTSPVFPKPIRVIVLSFSSVLRALCGVAAGSAKASLSAHFARWGNLGELNAKDSSQETVISLLGMLAGSVVVSWVTTPLTTWTVLILLLSIHLETNRRAVRAVSMRSLNRQRASLVCRALRRGVVPTPMQISFKEHIFEWDGVLRSSDNNISGYCHVGATMQQLLSSIGSPLSTQTGSVVVESSVIQKLLQIFQHKKYILWIDSRPTATHVDIVVKSGASAVDLLEAWWVALTVAEDTQELHKGVTTLDTARQLEELSMALALSERLLKDFKEDLVKAGWDLETAAVETTSSVRVSLTSE